MARRRQALDLREFQQAQLEEELREEAAAEGRSRGGPRGPAPRPHARAAPPPPPARARGPARGAFSDRETFSDRGSAPRAYESVREAEENWDAYAPDPSYNLLPEPQPGPAVGPGLRSERGLGLDVHELLKREAFMAPQPACDDHFEKNRPCPSGVYGISDQYMILDSFSKLRESRIEQGEFRWNFMVQGVTGDEVVGVKDKIDTVIEIQVAAFTMPIPPEVPYILVPPPPVSPSGTNRLVLVHNNANGVAGPPTLIPNALPYGQYPQTILTPPNTTITPWINNPYTQIPFGNRVTIQIREAGLQSFSDRNGARHHFEFTVTHISLAGLNPTMLQALPLSGSLWDSFIFTDPLKDVHGVTLIFRNPDIPIRFEPDCLYETTVVADGAAAPGPFLQFRFTAHGLHAGDRIFVLGFKSGIPTLDAYVNRVEGLVVSGDPALAPLAPSTPLATAGLPDVFWTDPAVSIIDFAPAPTLPQTVTVCIAKRRMRIPIRLRRVVGRLTNYVAP